MFLWLLLLFISTSIGFEILTDWTCYKCVLEQIPYTVYDASQKTSLSYYIQSGSNKAGWTITKKFNVNNSKNPVCVLQFTALPIVGNFSEKSINTGHPFIIVNDFLYVPLLQHYLKQISKHGIIRVNVPLTRMLYKENHTLAPDRKMQVSHISISGDWTRGHETIGFDNINLFC